MSLFNDNDILRLLLDGTGGNYGAHYHLGWETFSGPQSGAPEAMLTTLHEGFHNELNNLTAYGFLLQVFAFLARINPDTEKFNSILRELVSRCRNAHEVYATFMSTTISAERRENQGLSYQELLGQYPAYRQYYERGIRLTADFRGHYLKETALTGLIIVCFQSLTIFRQAIDDLAGFEPGNLRQREFPDSRLSFFGKHLPSTFLTDSFEEFCRQHAEDDRLELFRATETRPELYQVAIAPEYDELEKRLLAHLVAALEVWMAAQGLPCVPWEDNMNLLKTLFDQANKLAPGRISSQLMLMNDDPFNIHKNILLNFTSEKFHIREARFPARIMALREVPREYWRQLTGGLGNDEHLFVISRVGQRLQAQYQLEPNNQAWLDAHADEPLVFIRRRITSPESNQPQIQLFWIESPTEWQNLVEVCEGIPLVSNLSLHTWAMEDWAGEWLAPLTAHGDPTILFDLPPHRQMPHLFEACERVLINKVWAKHEAYQHCALMFRAKLPGGQEWTPFFILPASEAACNVISNYALWELKPGLFIEDKAFLQSNAWLVQILLGRLFNEERVFDFNTL